MKGLPLLEINLPLLQDSSLMSLLSCITLKSSQLKFNVENSLTDLDSKVESLKDA